MALIKEMQDLLKFVEQMPHAWQLDCAEELAMSINKWQQRQQSPDLSDDKWWDLECRRSRQRIQLRRERREREFPSLRKTM